MRDRYYERLIERSYMNDLNQAYEAFFSDHTACPVLTIDSNSLDFVANKSHLSHITNRIRAALSIPPFQPELPLEESP